MDEEMVDDLVIDSLKRFGKVLFVFGAQAPQLYRCACHWSVDIDDSIAFNTVGCQHKREGSVSPLAIDIVGALNLGTLKHLQPSKAANALVASIGLLR